MRILAIDPGRYCGFAYSAAKDRVEQSGAWDLGRDAAGRPGQLSTVLRSAIERLEPDVVAIEVATMGGRFAGPQARLNELAGVVKAAAGDLACECWEFHIGTWKSRAVGNGRAEKPAIIRGLKTFYGIEVADENEADAIGILLAAQQGTPPLPAKKEVRRVERELAKRQQVLFGTGKRRR